MRIIIAIRYLLVFLASFTAGGCARHYSGRVVDAHGRPVPYARVEGSGMYGGMITGEGVFVVKTVADTDGKFTLVTSHGPATITAICADLKRHGRVSLAISEPPVVIVVR